MKQKLSESQIWLVDYLSERYDPRKVKTEYQFCQERKWRFDVALIGIVHPCAFEIEGVGRTQDGKYGRHQSIGGFIADCEKLNYAAAKGWIRASGRQSSVGSSCCI